MRSEAHEIARAALSLSEDARTRFIDDSCAGDAALRTRVESLLQLEADATLLPDEQSERVLAPIGLDAPALNAHAESIGGFAIIERLGSGAMGIVYLAEQPSPRRRIALKIIRAEIVTDAVRERFEHETRVLARLKHPNIASIYQAGTAQVDGQPCPFFAMEFVEGETLDAHARALDVRERVELVARVCDAVEHAHQRGVVHRDLKPANILVEADGQPKVLDFGVARALDADAGTAGELAGTVPYMAPEQLACSDEADTRVDVYALGVILYELLAGARPHDTKGLGIAEAERRVRTSPVRSIRAHDADLPRDLDAIVLRALAVDAGQRYQSPNELAADLRRNLRHEPVSVRARTPAYVFGRFARRNPGAVGAGVAAAVLLVAGVAGVAWQAVEATRGWARAEAEAERAEAINDFLASMLASADPEVALGEELTVRELLDDAARNAEVELRGRPTIESSVRMTLSQTYGGLGRLEEAERNARRAVELSRDAFGPDDARTALAMLRLTGVLNDRGAYEDSEPIARRAIAILERARDADPVDVASAQGELARIAHDLGRPEEAVERWGEALERVRALVGGDDPQTLVLQHNFGSALGAMGRFDEAVEVFEDVVERRSRTMGDEHPQTIGARSMLAGVRQKMGLDAEAAEQFRIVLDARRRVLGDDHHATYTAMGNLAVALINLGELDEAESLTRTALDGYTRILGEDHAKTLVTMGNLAYMLEDRGKDDQAAALYRKTIAIRERSTGGRDPETWSTYNNLAMLLQRTGKPEEARPLYERVIRLCEESLPEGHIYTALFRNNYGSCLLDLNLHELAREHLMRSHDVIVARFGPEHQRSVTSAERLERLDAIASR
ncbi:MAG: serine/threonine-protein kinase [Planctomycetota bacterium]